MLRGTHLSSQWEPCLQCLVQGLAPVCTTHESHLCAICPRSLLSDITLVARNQSQSIYTKEIGKHCQSGLHPALESQLFTFPSTVPCTRSGRRTWRPPSSLPHFLLHAVAAWAAHGLQLSAGRVYTCPYRGFGPLCAVGQAELSPTSFCVSWPAPVPSPCSALPCWLERKRLFGRTGRPSSHGPLLTWLLLRLSPNLALRARKLDKEAGHPRWPRSEGFSRTWGHLVLSQVWSLTTG